jgi:hypothetical protein
MFEIRYWQIFHDRSVRKPNVYSFHRRQSVKLIFGNMGPWDGHPSAVKNPTRTIGLGGNDPLQRLIQSAVGRIDLNDHIFAQFGRLNAEWIPVTIASVVSFELQKVSPEAEASDPKCV